MRLAVCAMSAVLLSGCSWLGGFGSSGYGYSQTQKAQHSGQYGQYGSPALKNSHAGGFPQKPNFNGGYGASTYATGGYGSHAGDVAGQGANYQGAPRMRKPKLRGSLSLGIEKSNSGALLDYTKASGVDPTASYNPNTYAEGFTAGSIPSGNITSTVYTATVEKVSSPTISFDDVYSTPARLAAGVEYIASPNMTVFANGAYSVSEGNSGSVSQIEATLLKTVTSQDYDPDTNAPIGGPVVNTSFVPNQTVAHFAYDFNDMRRYDIEVGGRYYFDPVIKDQGHRTLTPFVAASVGASHYNKTDFSVSQQQLFYQRAFESSGGSGDFYDVPQPTTTTKIYDAQWTPTGNLTAGMEWQVTPGAALALETGLRFEKAREYSNGAKGENNIAVPLTLRGSFNF